MHLEFQLSEAEYHEALNWSGRQRGADWYRVMRWSGIAAAAIGVAVLIEVRSADAVAAIILVIFGLFVVVYPSFRYRSEVEKVWRKYSEVGPVTWEVLEDRIVYHSALSHSEFSWYRFVALGESKNLFLITDRFGEKWIFPKRTFADASQMTEFKRLVSERVNHPSPGFPLH